MEHQRAGKAGSEKYWHSLLGMCDEISQICREIDDEEVSELLQAELGTYQAEELELRTRYNFVKPEPAQVHMYQSQSLNLSQKSQIRLTIRAVRVRAAMMMRMRMRMTTTALWQALDQA